MYQSTNLPQAARRSYAVTTGILLAVLLLANFAFCASQSLASSAAEHLAQLERTSAAFRLVAAKLKPSVVSIQTVRIVNLASSGEVQPFWFPQDDPLLRRFFGEDFFDRFFGLQPRGGRPAPLLFFRGGLFRRTFRDRTTDAESNVQGS